MTVPPLNTGVFSATSLGEIGYSPQDQLSRWFGDSSVNPLVIMRGTEPVGFAMVAHGAAPGRPAVDYRMAEFFVLRTFRRRGVADGASDHDRPPPTLTPPPGEP